MPQLSFPGTLFTLSELDEPDSEETDHNESDHEEDIDPGPNMSSPVRGTKQEKEILRRHKAAKKLRLTHEEKLAKEALEAADTLKKDIEDVLTLLRQKNLRFGTFLEFVSDPDNGQGNARWHEFFVNPGEASRVLDHWVSSENSPTAREEVQSWAVNYVATQIKREAKIVTQSKILQTKDKAIDQDTVLSFSFAAINSQLQLSAPIGMGMLRAFSTAHDSEKKHRERRKERTNMTITVLSTLGLSESYTNIISKNKRRERQKVIDTPRTPNLEGSDCLVTPSAIDLAPLKCTDYTGTLHQLSDAMRARARVLAKTGCYTGVYDNINIVFKSPEQIMGRHDNQQNGTCTTLVPLFRAKLEDLKTTDYQRNFLDAPPLKLFDILHTSEERATFKSNLIFTILRIIIQHGGDDFKKYECDLEKSQPRSEQQIEIHKTDLHPLPAWKIDESSIIGNIEVDEAIRQELKLDEIPDCAQRLRFHAGDQLSLARFRAIENIRAGQETGFDAFFGSTWIPGLFHAKIADTHGTLLTHWGKPNTGTRNPGSLWFHNTRLDRLPITLTSLPSFRICRDLTFVSLYSRILHCLLLVSDTSSLEEYTSRFRCWDDLLTHAGMIYQQYTRSAVVEELRLKRKKQQGADSLDCSEGDMVFENAVLFLRDALISREFTEAIKTGDSGRVILVLKTWALSFRGNGRTKYAYEMLHLIHSLSSILSKEVRDIVLNNWLINPTGKPNSWVEVDLMQEHLNYWIKVFYKAHGSNASWEWLGSIAPCVDVLRQLAKNFNDVLGADQGTRHAPPQLSRDIATLMASLDEHNVYRIQRGRVLDSDDVPVKDVISSGYHSLTTGTKTPLTEYNDAFLRLQIRRKMTPVSVQMQNTVNVNHQPTDTELTIDPRPIPEPVNCHQVTGESDDPFIDNLQQSEVMETEEEATSEAVQILEDIQNGVIEPTLSVSSAEDVALDMDEGEEWMDSAQDIDYDLESSDDGTDDE